MLRSSLVFRVSLLITLVGIFGFLGLRQSPQLREVAWMPEWIGQWVDSHGVMRNAVGFFGLGLAVFFLFGPSGRIAAALCVFGTVLEVAQIWIPSREFDWRDIVTSVAGVLVAWACARALPRLFRAWER